MQHVRSFLSIAAVLLMFPGAFAQKQPIDTQRSTMTVHVFKAGLFSAFADNHEIRARIASGSLDPTARKVEATVTSADLVVLDPHLSPEKRQQVQERMLGPEVLDARQFPEIRFVATEVKEDGPGKFVVSGSLSLHGKTRPLVLRVMQADGHYHGSTALKQRDFGITPVSVAGGTVKVKDELKIDFDVVPGSPSTSASTGP